MYLYLTYITAGGRGQQEAAEYAPTAATFYHLCTSYKYSRLLCISNLVIAK